MNCLWWRLARSTSSLMWTYTAHLWAHSPRKRPPLALWPHVTLFHYKIRAYGRAAVDNVGKSVKIDCLSIERCNSSRAWKPDPYVQKNKDFSALHAYFSPVTQDTDVSLNFACTLLYMRSTNARLDIHCSGVRTASAFNSPENHQINRYAPRSLRNEVPLCLFQCEKNL